MDHELLTRDEIALVRSIWKKYACYKIELEDLLQEACLAKWLGRDVSKALCQYCEKWRRDPLSRARNDEKL